MRGSARAWRQELELDELAGAFLLEDDEEPESLFDDFDSDDDSDDFDSEPDVSLLAPSEPDFAPDFDDRLSVL